MSLNLFNIFFRISFHHSRPEFDLWFFDSGAYASNPPGGNNNQYLF